MTRQISIAGKVAAGNIIDMKYEEIIDLADTLVEVHPNATAIGNAILKWAHDALSHPDP